MREAGSGLSLLQCLIRAAAPPPTPREATGAAAQGSGPASAARVPAAPRGAAEARLPRKRPPSPPSPRPSAKPPPTPPDSFYGPPGSRLQRVEEASLAFLARVAHRERLRREHNPPAGPWHVFPTQAAAFRRADELDREGAPEDGDDGRGWGGEATEGWGEAVVRGRAAPDEACHAVGGARRAESGPGAGSRGEAAKDPPRSSGGRHRVFSLQRPADGRRLFAAGTEASALRRLGWLPAGRRHLYEVIRASRPCRLYFDVEYSLEAYPGAERGEAAVDELVSRSRAALAARCRNAVATDTRGPAHETPISIRVFELDSSTASKFSRHLIFSIDKDAVAFANSRAVGEFVREVLHEAAEEAAGGRGAIEGAAGLFPSLWGRSEGEADEAGAGGGGVEVRGPERGVAGAPAPPPPIASSIVDVAVYTRNRAFRTYLSSKHGKEAVLTNTGRFEGAGLDDAEAFRASLVSVLGAPGCLLGGRGWEGEWAEDGGWPREGSLNGREGQRGEEGGGAGSSWPGGGPAPGHSLTTPSCRGRRLPSAELEQRRAPLPIPGLAAFVETSVPPVPRRASVRVWSTLEADGSVLLFSLQGSRWCGRAGRAHKSNGTYLVLDLLLGTWVQRCHDPECAGWRSDPAPLPPDVVRAWREGVGGWGPRASPAGGLGTPAEGPRDGGGGRALDDPLALELSPEEVLAYELVDTGGVEGGAGGGAAVARQTDRLDDAELEACRLAEGSLRQAALGPPR